MTIKSNPALLQDLRELIGALDRRVPRLQGQGEHEIADDAQALKRAALRRIAELERSPAATETASAIAVKA